MKYGPDATVDEAPKSRLVSALEMVQVVVGCIVTVIIVWGVFRLLFAMMCAAFLAWG